MTEEARQSLLEFTRTMPRQSKLLRNSARCLVCEDHIVSEYGWDFRTCSCGTVSVDGGLEYRRRVFKDRDLWVDTSIYESQGEAS